MRIQKKDGDYYDPAYVAINYISSEAFQDNQQKIKEFLKKNPIKSKDENITTHTEITRTVTKIYSTQLNYLEEKSITAGRIAGKTLFFAMVLDPFCHGKFDHLALPLKNSNASSLPMSYPSHIMAYFMLEDPKYSQKTMARVTKAILRDSPNPEYPTQDSDLSNHLHTIVDAAAYLINQDVTDFYKGPLEETVLNDIQKRARLTDDPERNAYRTILTLSMIYDTYSENRND